MKKRLVCAVLSAAIAAMTMAGCQSSSGTSPASGGSADSGSTGTAASGSPAPAVKEHKTLEFIFPQNNPSNDWDLVMKQFEEETKDTLNLSINCTITGFDDIGQKVSLKLTSGQAIDSVFVAQWTSPSVQEMSLKGQLMNLDAYFQNDAYPGLKAAFNEDYIGQNKFIGEDGEYHAFAVPFAHEYGATGSYLYYRLDLAKKYGLGELKNRGDMLKYFDAILANEPGMTPYVSLTMDGFFQLAGESVYTPAAPEKHNYKIDNPAAASARTYVIKPDGTAYVPRNIVPWLDEEFISYLPDGLYNKDDLLWQYNAARDWYEKGYVSADVMNITDHQGLFCNGKAASFTRGIDTYTAISTQLLSSVPGAEVGVVDVGVYSGMKKQVGCSFQAWNFAAIPATCQDVDRVMEFYNWLFEDQKNHDLFEYGVEGKHWTAEDDSTYKPQANPDTGKEWNFEGYVMTWNPGVRRFDSTAPDFVTEELKKGGIADNFYKYADAGFSFNTEPIKTVDAKITEIRSQMSGLVNGSIADIQGEIDQINGRLEKADFEQWCVELEKQLNDYLQTNPYEGQ